MSRDDDGPLHGRVGDGATQHPPGTLHAFVRCVGSPPEYATQGASGADLRSAERVTLFDGERRVIRTGLRIALAPGTEGQVRPRSGMTKRGIDVPLGTIDRDYRGEIGVCMVNRSGKPFDVEPGDRIAQLVIAPVLHATFAVVEKIDDTARGDGGFGSTGHR